MVESIKPETNENNSIENDTKSVKEKEIKKAISLHLKGDISKAMECYKNCLEKGFYNPLVLSNLGIIYQQRGEVEKAIQLYKKSISYFPNNPEAYVNLGTIFFDIGKLKEAEIFQRKANELKPDHAIAYNNLGNTLRGLGRLDESEKLLRKSIELNQEFSNSHYNLGIVLKELGRLEDAENSLKKAIKINPNYAMAYNNLGGVLGDLGKLEEARITLLKAIELKPMYVMAYNNLGVTLKDLGKLSEAEKYFRKAIEINPNYAESYGNLGSILNVIGDLQSAEINFKKAIKINSNYARCYFLLSFLNTNSEGQKWLLKLFSDELINNINSKDLIDIYFARANILHKRKQYKKSANYLVKANNLKIETLHIKPQYLTRKIFVKSKYLLTSSDKEEFISEVQPSFPENIFIVGMPRSGSTLVESIISLNEMVFDLGEVNIFEESFYEWKDSIKSLTNRKLYEIYLEKIPKHINKTSTITNKWLFNYQYIGFIAKKIPYSRIIYCFRNPLDNILSIYKAHFHKGNEYSSSLVDCAELYLNHKKTMIEYNKRYKAKIYNLDYDLLASNPSNEIRSLITWLGWKWDDSYLSPHLNPRSVQTASSVQVRSPINSKSIGGWKNYKDMLQPAMEILSKADSYQELTS